MASLLTPNMLEFHGDGRYGAPPNPAAAAGEAGATDAAAAAEAQGIRAPGTIGRILKTTGQVGSNAVRLGGDLAKIAGPTALGITAKRAIATGLADNTVSGPVPPMDPTADRSQGAAAVPTAADMGLPNTLRAPPQEPGNWFRDTEFGRNAGNFMNALSGATGGLPAAANIATRFGRGIGTAAAAGEAAVRGAVADNAMNPTPATVAPQGPPVQPVGAPVPPSPAADPSGPVANDPQGLRPQDPNRLPATATFDEMLGAGRALDAYGPGAHTPDGRGGGAGIIDTSNVGANSAHNQNFAADVMSGKVDQALRLGGLHGPQQAQAIAAAYQNRAGNSSAERIANIREMGETARTLATNNAQKSIHDSENQVTLRGQDQILAGHRMANDVAVAQARRDQGNKDRQFALDEDKYGTEKAKANFERREASAKNLPNEIAGMLPPGADGKPDLANGARHAQGMMNAVADLLQNASPAVKAKFNEEGIGAIDPSDKRRLLAGMQLSDVANATATNGLTPWGTRAIQSNAPIMAIRKLPNGDYQTNRTGPNGETEVIPARFIEKEGSTFGLGGQASNKFSSLMVH